MDVTYTIVLAPCEEGGYSVTVPALPGCVTEGDTILGALTMAKEAIECFVESLAIDGEPIPEEGNTISVDVEQLTEGLLFRVTATPNIPVEAYA